MRAHSRLRACFRPVSPILFPEDLNKHNQVDTPMIRTKKNTFQLELSNRFIALEDRDDVDSQNKNMTGMIQRNATSIAKQTKKQKTPKISSPTRALTKN